MVKESHHTTKGIEEKLACSLTAETPELLPFLPYLLQDFWELGSDPDVMIKLIEKHIKITKNTRILDLACGKGAVSVRIAQKFRVSVKGVDLIPDFLEYAIKKAQENGVDDLCDFEVGDINEWVNAEMGYDCVILGAVGDVLGSPADTLRKLKSTVKPGGFILIDESYLPDNWKQEDVKYSNYDYLTEKQWSDLFSEAELALLDTVSGADAADANNPDSNEGMAFITARANELIAKHPDMKDIFEGYIQSQQNEYDDIDGRLVCVTWMLRKAEEG